ncbi:MAG: hypothetical protein KJ601_05160, partial [Nanoarchaeota archaeon]|nr:hypothetical protein [Nanoarchaeota archaeon]
AQKHMKLLAVKEGVDTNEGSIADLYLETQSGKGRVFIDTYPLTQFDTQISTRYARDVACDILNKQCLDKDFIYTIKADTVIVAGPSAGAAIAALTIAELMGFEVDESIAVTGTINSGGLIGPVGGLKEKIEAAAAFGLSKVMIPAGNFNITNKTSNKSISLVDYGVIKGIKVIPVSTINDVLAELTGKKLKEPAGEIEVNPKFQQMMKKLALDLCNRARVLQKEDAEKPEDEEYNITNTLLTKEVEGLLNKSKKAYQEEKYYSAASFCFGANAKLSYLNALKKNYSQAELKNMIAELEKEIDYIENEINDVRKVSISDLEAFAAVRERILEARYVIEDAKKNDSDIQVYPIIYAGERVYSAKSWQSFFGFGGKGIDLSKESLKGSCLKKIKEAQERYEYVKFITTIDLFDTEKGISYAKEDYNSGEYELCLFKASKAKAETDVILNILGVTDSQVRDITDRKLNIVKNEIIKEIKSGNYPIIGYSYYEYANVLKEDDAHSALIYAEYSLELSNLGMYFEAKKLDAWFFIILIGVIVAVTGFGLLFKPKKQINKKKVIKKPGRIPKYPAGKKR